MNDAMALCARSAIRKALVTLGVQLHGERGIGPTGKQWNQRRPAGMPVAESLCRRCLPLSEKYGFEQWNDLLKLANLRYPPDLLAMARRQAVSNDPHYTGEPVEFSYGRAQDSVLHTREWTERTIWHPGLRRDVTVEIAMVVSGERVRPVQTA